MKALRSYISAFVVAVLVLTGQAMAEARMIASPTGEIVICTGTGPLAVSVDASGKPTGPAHICPECALALFADFSAPVTAPLRVMVGGERVSFTHGARAPALGILKASARGPPATV